MVRSVSAQAACRVDLAGGTLDIWPLGVLHPGAVTVNVALDFTARVQIQPLPGRAWRVAFDGQEVTASSLAELRGQSATALVGLLLEALEVSPCLISLATDSPRGAGLGGSSALACALVGAATAAAGRATPEAAEVVALVRDLEAQLMGFPTGCQDQYAACRGGVTVIKHRPGGERAEGVDCDLAALSEHLMVVYTGQSHISAVSNWQVVRRRLDGDSRSIQCFDAIAAVARDVAVALAAGDLRAVGGLLAAEWESRRQLSTEIATPTVDQVLSAAARCDAWGGKVCGAGGGGCVVVLADPAAHPAIAGAIAQIPDCGVLPTRASAAGLIVSG